MNKHLSTCMKGLTAKVFRTYNASFTFQEELRKTPEEGSIAEKVLAYNRANREVAVLCNHQRSVPKAHGNQIGRIQDKINFLKYERMLVKRALISDDPKLKKKRPELLEEESDFEQDLQDSIVEAMKKGDLEKMRKKMEKANEKIKAGEAEGDLVSESEIVRTLEKAEGSVGAVALEEKISKMNGERFELC